MRRLLIGLALLTVAAAPVARIIPDPWPRPQSSATEVRRALAAALERGDRHAVTLGLYDLANMGFALSPETQARLRPLVDPALLLAPWRAARPAATPSPIASDTMRRRWNRARHLPRFRPSTG